MSKIPPKKSNVREESIIYKSPTKPNKPAKLELEMIHLLPSMKIEDIVEHAKRAKERVNKALETSANHRSVTKDDKITIQKETSDLVEMVYDLAERLNEKERGRLNKEVVTHKVQNINGRFEEEIGKKLEDIYTLLEETKKEAEKCTNLHEGSKNEIIKKIEEIEIREVEKPQKATYASVIGRQKVPPKTLHSLIIASTDDRLTSDEVMESVKKTAEEDGDGEWIKVQKMRKAKNQKVIIACENEKEVEKLQKRLEKDKTLTMEKAINKNPLVVVKFVRGDKKKEQVEEAIRRKMENLIDKKKDIKEQIDAIYEKRTRNQHVAHIVVKVSPAIWQQLTESGSIQLQWGISKVEDQTPLIQCSRCLGYGHIKRVCQEQLDSCSHCGGDHLYDACNEKYSPPSCLNCKKANLEDKAHNTFNVMCPIRAKWDRLARAKVAYC